MNTSGQERPGRNEFAFESFDSETVGRIDSHLARAQETDDSTRKDFHLRHARQLLEATKE
jgi:hypothetical protein